MYVGVLPYAVVGGRRVFLLGQENAEDWYESHDLWSDFGGGAHDPGNIARSAAEELYEETMGAFGPVAQLEKALLTDARRITLSGGVGYVFLWPIRYDPHFVTAWNNIWQYITACTRSKSGKLHIDSCPEGYLEKKRIGWFTESDLRGVLAGKPHPAAAQFRVPFLRSLAEILQRMHAKKMPAAEPAKKTPAKKMPAKKTPAKKTPAKKTPAKQIAKKPTKHRHKKPAAAKRPATKPAKKRKKPAKR